jgi:hypothetical protein
VLDIQPRDIGGGDAASPDEVMFELIKKIKKMVPPNIDVEYDQDEL